MNCDEYNIIGSGGEQANKIEKLVSKITNKPYVDSLSDNQLSEDIQKVLKDDLETQKIGSSLSLPREIGTAKDVNNILLASNWKEIVNNLLPDIEKAYGVVKYKKDDTFINRDNTVKITINDVFRNVPRKRNNPSASACKRMRLGKLKGKGAEQLLMMIII